MIDYENMPEIQEKMGLLPKGSTIDFKVSKSRIHGKFEEILETNILYNKPDMDGNPPLPTTIKHLASMGTQQHLNKVHWVLDKMKPQKIGAQ